MRLFAGVNRLVLLSMKICFIIILLSRSNPAAAKMVSHVFI